jgi:hypothetical protein
MSVRAGITPIPTEKWYFIYNTHSNNLVLYNSRSVLKFSFFRAKFKDRKLCVRAGITPIPSEKWYFLYYAHRNNIVLYISRSLLELSFFRAKFKDRKLCVQEQVSRGNPLKNGTSLTRHIRIILFRIFSDHYRLIRSF